MSWFKTERGITDETLKAFGIEIQNGVATYPYPSGKRYRTIGERDFKWEKGSKVSLLMAPVTGNEGNTAFIVEGETDAMRLWQEIKGTAYVFAMPGVDSWQDGWAQEVLKWANQVVVVLDNDQDYNVKAQVDAAYKRIKKALSSHARRAYLPPSVKDICEFFSLYDVEMFKQLVKKSAKSRFKPLDLTASPGPVPWLVPRLVCLGDVTLAAGDPGLGKSWLTMSLAVAVAEGHGKWLGRDVLQHGPVLYIDEENPQDVVLRRMEKLGLTAKGASNLRYLHRQGIWLDRMADEVLEEALDLQPTLIVVDSLSRIHTGDENSASSMAALFKEGITPLARETGAAVMVIHHSNKGDSPNSFVRTRGSGDISASVDAAIDIRPTAVNGVFTVALYKSRRALVNDVIPVTLKDQGDKVVLEVKSTSTSEVF